jgi:Flp pilus assembly pilin Flp
LWACRKRHNRSGRFASPYSSPEATGNLGLQLITSFADFAGIMVYILGHPSVGIEQSQSCWCFGDWMRTAGSNQPGKNSGLPWRLVMQDLYRKLWRDDEGQDIAEYAVMLAVILVIVVGTIRLIGSNANNVFSNVASSLQ